MTNVRDVKKIGKTAEESGIGEDVEHLPPRYECPICLDCLKEPVLTRCGHKFCSKCINDWCSQKIPPHCPVDLCPLESKDLFRDLCTSREILQERSQCPYQKFGCSVELSLVEMEPHVKNCRYKNSLHCTFKSLGCVEKFLTEEALNSHLREQISSHLTMLLKVVPHSLKTQSDPKALESNLWDVSQKSKSGESSREPFDQQQELIKVLYEKLITLEQETHVLRNQLSTLRNSQGVLIWRLKPFDKTLKEMKDCTRQFIYSPAFYSRANGYKFCARLNIFRENPGFLSLVVHMLQSDDDDALDWPFHGRVSFVLVHSQDSSKNIHETAMSLPDLATFQRPKVRSQTGFGFMEFVRIEELSEFLRDDELILRIQVTSSNDKFELEC